MSANRRGPSGSTASSNQWDAHPYLGAALRVAALLVPIGVAIATAVVLARLLPVAGVVLIGLAGATALTASGWADIIVGLLLVVLNGSAAKEVWEAATEESLAAKALAGDIDDD